MQNELKKTKNIALKLLNKVTFDVLKKIESKTHGNYRSIFIGSGLEFNDIREYTQNDDIRSIDWNVTARMDKPYIKTYEEEKELVFWLVVDLNQSMNFGSKEKSKRDVLTIFSSVISHIVNKQNNKLGLIIIDGTIKLIVPPSKGIKHVNLVINKILNYKADENYIENNNIFKKIGKIIGKKNYVFFMSDFTYSDFWWEKDFAALANKNSLEIVEIWDKVEELMEDVGYINIQDYKTGKVLTIDSSNKKVIDEYKKLLDSENSKKAEIFSKTKVKKIKLYTDSDIADVILGRK